MKSFRISCTVLATAFFGLLGACSTDSETRSPKKLESAPYAAVQYALNSLESGEALRWEDGQSGYRGSIVPLRTFRIAGGGYCRDYQVIYLSPQGGGEIRLETACRNAKIWQRAS